MKHLLVFLFLAATLAAADDPVSRLLNPKLTASQRNDGCFALRNDHSPAVNAAMRTALASEPVRACAARHLREAGAIELLQDALSAPEPDVRATAARELGSFERPELLEPLAKAARDPNALVATNAVMGLGQYRSRVALPYLLELAKAGGAAGIVALSYAARFRDPATLPLSRNLLTGTDVPAKLLAIRVIADLGDAQDLPRLREIAAKSDPVPIRTRGFGLMPAIDLARAAKYAIAAIQGRTGGAQN
jgi:HEAT repeat protein